MLNKTKYYIFKNINRKIMENDINMEELKQKQANGAIIIDVRNKKEFSEGNILGSINIPEYEINKNFNLIKNKNMEIVLYCSSGYRSLLAYKKLKKLGYTKVYNLYGGLENN